MSEEYREKFFFFFDIEYSEEYRESSVSRIRQLKRMIVDYHLKKVEYDCGFLTVYSSYAYNMGSNQSLAIFLYPM